MPVWPFGSLFLIVYCWVGSKFCLFHFIFLLICYYLSISWKVLSGAGGAVVILAYLGKHRNHYHYVKAFTINIHTWYLNVRSYTFKWIILGNYSKNILINRSIYFYYLFYLSVTNGQGGGAADLVIERKSLFQDIHYFFKNRGEGQLPPPQAKSEMTPLRRTHREKPIDT